MINSILASVVVINVHSGYSGFKFLKALEGRLTYSRNESEDYNLKNELANLIILQRGGAQEANLYNDRNRIESI